jgi:hypothetical protein
MMRPACDSSSWRTLEIDVQLTESPHHPVLSLEAASEMQLVTFNETIVYEAKQN